MGGMSTLYIGVSGLQASQSAINTTAHNLSNLHTPGYVRQQVVFGDRSYETLSVGPVYYNQSGRGVSVMDIRHVRDVLLDKAYRQESGREAFYESQAQVIEEIEGYFGELEGERFQDYLKNMWNAIQEVSKNPLGTETRAALVQSAVSFISKANSIYTDMRNYQLTINQKIINSVNRINEIGEEIHDLNKMISKIEVGDIESANDYRDRRDYLLDELGGLIDISYKELPNGVVTVRAENVDFITENGYYEMDLIHPAGDADPELVVPVWNYLNQKEVFNITADVSTVKENDIGSLKSYILARGSATANYTDVPNQADFDGGLESAEYIRKINSGNYFAIRGSDGRYLTQISYKGKDGQNKTVTISDGNTLDRAAVRGIEKELGIKAIDWTDYQNVNGEAGSSKAYQEAMEYYDDYVIPSSIMTIMAEFDQLINKIVEDINEVISPTMKLEPSVTVKDKDGNLINSPSGIRVMDVSAAGYGKDENRTQGTELFSRKHTKRYIECYQTNADGTQYIDEEGNLTTDQTKAKKYYVYNYQSEFDLESLYSLTNLEVNPDILSNNQLIPFSTKDGGENRKLMDDMNALWEKDDLVLLPEYSSRKNYQNYYTEFIGQMAGAGELYNDMIAQQEKLIEGIDGVRRQITDISSDEELQNLIKYQAAYNASSRFVTVIDQMLELIVTQL
ncbi:MAG: flagellar hook-associated protein FlgK [Lachnospiraceae bacterium]|nr:flagellar hook-associated protein FlgK [Lachnospiraceae bacterium]